MMAQDAKRPGDRRIAGMRRWRWFRAGTQSIGRSPCRHPAWWRRPGTHNV